MNQCDLILKIMRRDGAISKRVADNYHIENLKGRIHDLRAAGYKIETVYKRDVLGKRYASYSLVK